MTGRPAIVQFCKWPEPGRVKSRLATDVGEDSACELYRWMARRCFLDMRALEEESSLVLYHTGACGDDFARWLPGADAYWPQPRKPLGERIAAGLRQAFEELNATAAIAVGTDCPLLDANALRPLLAALQDHDVAIIPARDGGYAAIGLSRFIPSLFEEIDWSTSRVFSQTTDRCTAAALTWWTGSILSDIDTLADWERVAPHFPDAPLLKRVGS